MLDLSYFQNSGNVNTQTFTNAGTWQTWVKPRKAKFVNILCIGAGGGGASGGALTGASRQGGRGGGSGAITRAQFQASILPDILYVQCGIGGIGGAGVTNTATGSDGSNGASSFISITPDNTNVSSILVRSGNVAATGAGKSIGTATSGSTGTGETAATSANMILVNLGTFISIAGVNAGTNTVTPTQPTTGGALGGTTLASGAPNAGSNILTAGPIPQINGGASSTTQAGRGGDGIVLYKPVLSFTGGAGGGASNTANGNGGSGGNAAYGCGGGGGGVGATGGTSGNGGKGGDGIIIITTSF